MTLDLKWFQGIDPKKKPEFEQLLRNTSIVFGKLSEILDDLDQQALKSTKTDYDSPSWAYKQADNNGYRRCLRELKALINLE